MFSRQQFTLNLPPFRFHVTTDIDLVYENAKLIYAGSIDAVSNEDEYIDYYLSVTNAGGLRRWYKPQARFMCDIKEPFKPLNQSQAYAMLEWGMNWAIASHELEHVIIHSGVLAKDNKAILFPAPPGSGKSTLTAHLANNGWRLLSDEMAMIKRNTRTVMPFVRPICLKNSSIDLCRSWFPQATFSSIAKDTHKGDVIHMAPPSQAVLHNQQEAEIVGVVFPNYRPDSNFDIYQLNQTEAFMQLADNAFNFTVIGQPAFETLTDLVEQVPVFDIHHNDLSAVQAFLEEDIIGVN